MPSSCRFFSGAAYETLTVSVRTLPAAEYWDELSYSAPQTHPNPNPVFAPPKIALTKTHRLTTLSAAIRAIKPGTSYWHSGGEGKKKPPVSGAAKSL